MLRIGIFGLGSVGSGLIHILKKGNYPIQIKKIVDRSFEKKKELYGDIPASNNPADILDDPEIDVVVELIGGIEQALYILREAIDKKKHVITANKAVLAEHGYALFPKAHFNKVSLGYEAAVAGAIPVIHNLNSVFLNEPISLLQGILNGTSNYILTKMRSEQQSFNNTLSEAQKLGLAEADPSLDINGMDACHKLALLASMISGKWVDYRRIPVLGIENINLNDIQFAEQLGYRIRLVGHYEPSADSVNVLLMPMLVAAGNPLFHVENEDNAIFIKGEYSGMNMFQGKGAGSLPTASSVLADLLRIEKEPAANNALYYTEYAEIAPLQALECPFYLSFQVPDQPGTLSALTGCLAEESISIHSALHSKDKLDGQAGLVQQSLVVQKTDLQSITKALEKMKTQGLVETNPVYLPIDDEILLSK